MRLKIALKNFMGCTFWENVNLSWNTLLKNEPKCSEKVIDERLIKKDGKKFSFHGNYRKDNIDFYIKAEKNRGRECILRPLPFDKNASDMKHKIDRDFWMLYVEEQEIEPMTFEELHELLVATA